MARGRASTPHSFMGIAFLRGGDKHFTQKQTIARSNHGPVAEVAIDGIKAHE